MGDFSTGEMGKFQPALTIRKKSAFHHGLLVIKSHLLCHLSYRPPLREQNFTTAARAQHHRSPRPRRAPPPRPAPPGRGHRSGWSQSHARHWSEILRRRGPARRPGCAVFPKSSRMQPMRLSTPALFALDLRPGDGSTIPRCDRARAGDAATLARQAGWPASPGAWRTWPVVRPGRAPPAAAPPRRPMASYYFFFPVPKLRVR